MSCRDDGLDTRATNRSETLPRQVRGLATGQAQFPAGSVLRSRRCLIVIYGAAFRNRRKTPDIGSTEIADQQIATRSHLGLVEYLTGAYLYHCDTQLITYHTAYDEVLRRWYQPNEAVFLGTPMPSGIAFYRFVLQVISLCEVYDFVLLVRTDLALKEYFLSVFRPHATQVMVSFPCCNDARQPWWWVGDMLGFLPRELFFLRDRGFYFFHDAYLRLRRWGLSRHLGVYVHSHHRPQTGCGWNPLYYLPARPLNKRIDRPFMRDFVRQVDYPYDPQRVFDIEAIDRRILGCRIELAM